MRKFLKTMLRFLSDVGYCIIGFMFTEAFLCIAWVIIIGALIIKLVFI